MPPRPRSRIGRAQEVGEHDDAVAVDPVAQQLVLEGHVEEPSGDGDRGVVHEQPDLEAVDRRGDDVADRRVAEVGDQRTGLDAVGRRDLVGHGAEPVLAPRHHHDVQPAPCRFVRQGRADAHRRAGNQRPRAVLLTELHAGVLPHEEVPAQPSQRCSVDVEPLAQVLRERAELVIDRPERRFDVLRLHADRVRVPRGRRRAPRTAPWRPRCSTGSRRPRCRAARRAR